MHAVAHCAAVVPFPCACVHRGQAAVQGVVSWTCATPHTQDGLKPLLLEHTVRHADGPLANQLAFPKVELDLFEEFNGVHGFAFNKVTSTVTAALSLKCQANIAKLAIAVL